MKILFYSHSSTTYGAPTSLLNLISGMKDLYDVECHVVLPQNGSLENKLLEENISYSIIPHYKWSYRYSLYAKKVKKNRLLGMLWYLKNHLQYKIKNKLNIQRHQVLVQEFKPDAVYVNSSLAPMGCIIALKNNLPYFWHHRETVNDQATDFYLYDDEKFRTLFQKAAMHIYPSSFLKEKYAPYHTSSTHIPIENVVYNGVKESSINYLKVRKIEAPLKFGIIGRINEQKGQEEILKIINQINYSDKSSSKIQLHIFGDGEKDYIEDLKKKYNDKNIIFEGFKDRGYIFSKIDFLIVNAKNESFGRVVAEANAHGIPVIGRQSGALKEIIMHEINGFGYSSSAELLQIFLFLVNHRDLTAFYQKIAKSSRSIFDLNFSNDQTSKTIHEHIRLALNR